MKKKLITIILTTMVVASLVACGSDQEKEPEKAPAVEEDLPEKEPEKETEEIPEETPEEDNTRIKGSHAHDVTVSLSDVGIPEANKVTTDDGYQFDSSDGSYAYSITANKDHEIMCATFSVLTGSNDEGYLQFCSSLPYDQANPDAAAAWVAENLGADAETTIGDAIFTMTNGTQGPILTIKAVGFDDYVLNKALQ